MAEWVSVMTEYSSLDNFEKAGSEAHKQLEQSQLQLQTTEQAEAALQSQVASLTAEVGHLRSRFQDVNHTRNELMSHSMDQIEMILSLHSQLTSKSSNSQPLLRLLRQLLLTLITDFDNHVTPNDSFGVLTCCSNVFTRTSLRRQMTLWFKQPAAWLLSSY